MKQKRTQFNLPRRRFLMASAAATALFTLPRFAFTKDQSKGASPMTLSPEDMAAWQLLEAEWKKRLTPEQFHVMRKHGTERPFSSPLDTEKREGTFHCVACDLPLYESSTKYDSGTGWPSFWAPIEGHVATSVDYKLVWPRTEVHCARCKGHLGHVFKDGPPPTGKRHCINGVAMTFKPKAL